MLQVGVKGLALCDCVNLLLAWFAVPAETEGTRLIK